MYSWFLLPWRVGAYFLARGIGCRLTFFPFRRIEMLVELEHIPRLVHLSARFVRMGRLPKVRGRSCRL